VYLLLFPAVSIYYLLIPRYAKKPLVAGNAIAVAWLLAVVVLGLYGMLDEDDDSGSWRLRDSGEQPRVRGRYAVDPERPQAVDRAPLVDGPGVEACGTRADLVQELGVDQPMLRHQRVPASRSETREHEVAPVAPAAAQPSDTAADRDAGPDAGLELSDPVEYGGNLTAYQRPLEQSGVPESVEHGGLAAGVLEVDVQTDVREASRAEMCERVVEPHVPPAPSMKDRVREYELALPRPHIELDHVDSDPERRVK